MSEDEARVAVIGTVASGKTTVLGLTYLTALDLALKDKDIKVDLIEKTFGIREVPSRLMDGRFPPKTKVDEVFEADLVLEWQRLLGPTKLVLPFVETAGETIQKMIQRFTREVYSISDLSGAREIHNHILQAKGYILVLPTDRILGFDEEPDEISRDPDVNASRFLDAIFSFKRKSPQSSAVKGIAVVFTKYDIMRVPLSIHKMNVSTQEGMEKFVDTFFPQTYNALKNIGLNKVKFLHSWVEIEFDAQGNPLISSDEPRSPSNFRIKVNRKARRPIYSKDTYIELIGWLKKTFTRAR